MEDDLLARIRNVILFSPFFWTMIVFGSFISGIIVGGNVVRGSGGKWEMFKVF